MIEWVQLKNDQIIHRTLFRRDEIALDDLKVIYYHYSAAVGITEFLWEVCSTDGRKIAAHIFTFGRSRLLKALEKRLPGFSMLRFKQLFEAGDVEDILEVWKRDDANNASDATSEPAPGADSSSHQG
jgi:hypothetical protein